MKWETIKKQHSPVFKRLTGVSKDTFNTMINEVVRLWPKSTHKVFGSKRGP